MRLEQLELCRFALIIAAVCAVEGCGGQNPTAPAVLDRTVPADYVTVVAASPERGATLARASTVSIKLEVRYALTTADAGRIVLAAQDRQFFPLQPGQQPIVTVSRGDGTVHLSTTLNVPDSGSAFDLFVALAKDGVATTDIAEKITYLIR
jgi:hypothetical protein